MSKILFVDTVMNRFGEGPRAAATSVISNLRNTGHRVEFVPFRVLNQDIGLKEYLKIENKFVKEAAMRSSGKDFILISGWTGSSDRMKRVASAARKKSKGCIICGGSHADLTYFYRKDYCKKPLNVLFKQMPDIDIAVFGEGENTILELVSGKDLDSIAGIAFKKKGLGINNKCRPLIDNLDKLPKLNLIRNDFPKRPIWAYIETSRGCRYGCKFCSEPLKWCDPENPKKRYRKKSVKRVIEELEYLRNEFKISNFRFTDSSLTSNNQLEELCNQIIDNKKLSGIKWAAFARVNELIQGAQLGLMKRSGCETLLVGYETGSQAILDRMGKGHKLKDGIKATKLIKSEGIRIRGSWVIGFPGENSSTVRESIRFAKELDLDANAVHLYENQEEMFMKYKFGPLGYLVDVPDKVINEMVRGIGSPLTGAYEMHYLTRLSEDGVCFYRGSKSIIEQYRLLRLFIKEVTKADSTFDLANRFDRVRFVNGKKK